MENRWSEADAAAFVAERELRVGEDLALRTYSSRLIGADPELVLHGGGNTSLKGARTDILGPTVEALYMKATGRDLASSQETLAEVSRPEEEEAIEVGHHACRAGHRSRARHPDATSPRGSRRSGSTGSPTRCCGLMRTTSTPRIG